jgi:hypothetical protein
LKADLMRILRERDHPEKSRNKEIVVRAGEAVAGVNLVYQKMLETEDDVEVSEDMKRRSAWCSSALIKRSRWCQRALTPR